METGHVVKIENGVLWIGNEAYPLRNISHVGSRVLDPRPLKAKAVKSFIVGTVLCLIVAGAVGAGFTAGAVFVLLGGMALLTWRLVKTLKLQTIHGLVLNTSGVQQDALWSSEQSEITKLISAITEAIGHPDTARNIFDLSNVVQDVRIQQFGASNVGKQIGPAGA